MATITTQSPASLLLNNNNNNTTTITDQYSDILLSHKIAYSGLAGLGGTTCIYPIDYVKTQLMNQKTNIIKLYNGPISCVKYVYNTYGLSGFYRGYPPNAIFVMPEKALKLTLNDALRNKLRSMSYDKKTLTYTNEMLAGGLAGFIQVLCTNPMELLKIKAATANANANANIQHIQLQKHINNNNNKFSYKQLLQSLGIRGLYTGLYICI